MGSATRQNRWSGLKATRIWSTPRPTRSTSELDTTIEEDLAIQIWDGTAAAAGVGHYDPKEIWSEQRCAEHMVWRKNRRKRVLLNRSAKLKEALKMNIRTDQVVRDAYEKHLQHELGDGPPAPPIATIRIPTEYGALNTSSTPPSSSHSTTSTTPSKPLSDKRKAIVTDLTPSKTPKGDAPNPPPPPRSPAREQHRQDPPTTEGLTVTIAPARNQNCHLSAKSRTDPSFVSAKFSTSSHLCTLHSPIRLPATVCGSHFWTPPNSPTSHPTDFCAPSIFATHLHAFPRLNVPPRFCSSCHSRTELGTFGLAPLFWYQRSIIYSDL